MTRKDYVLIADILRDELAERKEYCDIAAVDAVRSVAQRFAARLAEDNPRFDRARFFKAVAV